VRRTNEPKKKSEGGGGGNSKGGRHVAHLHRTGPLAQNRKKEALGKKSSQRCRPEEGGGEERRSLLRGREEGPLFRGNNYGKEARGEGKKGEDRSHRL